MYSSAVVVRVSDYVSVVGGRMFCSVRIIMRSRSSLVTLSEIFPCVFSLLTCFVKLFFMAMHLAMLVCMDVMLAVLVDDWGDVGGMRDFLRVSNIW